MFGNVLGVTKVFNVVGLAFLAGTFFLIDNKTKKWIIILVLLVPFLSSFGFLTIRDKLVYMYPVVAIAIINTFLGLYFKLQYLKRLKKKVIVICASTYLLLFMVGGYFFMCNWVGYVFSKEVILETGKVSDVNIYDLSDNEIKLDETENKIIILDFWSLDCGYCFRKFADFEKLKKYYNSDDILFYAVYIPFNSKDDKLLEERLKWIEEQNYTFNIVKTDSITAAKLEIRAVPHILIFDRNKEVAYNNGYGDEIENRMIIDNLYSVIDKLLVQPKHE